MTHDPPADEPLRVRARVGDPARPRLDVDIVAASTGVIGVVGPNGAGKTTLLRAVAGLETLNDSATVCIDGRDVTRTSPALRRVAYVPQSGALFPHLSVRDNVAYGLRASGLPRPEARHRSEAQLQTLEISHLADRSPRTLSGGQAQRVAIARALAIDPRVILLDEPTAALDAASRTEVRSTLHRHLTDFPGVTLLVTHDASEVLTLAERVLVLENGRVRQDAANEELITRPGSRWLAHLLNLNGWAGAVARQGEVVLDAGGRLHAVELPAVGSRVLLAAAPTSITLFTEQPNSSARNLWSALVDDVSVLGDRVRVALLADTERVMGDGPHRAVAEVTRDAVTQLGIRPGASVYAAIKATDLTVSLL